MNHSLNDIATQVINAVYAGLKKPSNYSLSLAQVKDEFAQARNQYIEAKVATGVFDSEPFMQTLNKLPVAKDDFSNIVGYTTNRQEYKATIPEIMHFKGLKSVSYISAMNKTFPFKVCFGNDIFHVLSDRYTGDKPTIWIQDISLWLLNPPVANIQHITMRAVLENPRSVNSIPTMRFIDDDPYPIPGSVIDIIRSKMVYDYIRQYRMANISPTLLASDLGNSNEQK